MDKIKKGRNWEGILVIVLLLAVFVILTPYFISIIYNSQVKGALAGSESLVKSVKTTYTEGNLTDIISLPFEVTYEKKEYIAYSDGEKINVKIKTEGKLPKSGSIIINKDGEVLIKDLRFGLVACNKKAKDSEVTCA